MSELSQLSPQPLWDIFAKICSIPHPSYHEEQLAEHIMGWAKEKGFFKTPSEDDPENILFPDLPLNIVSPKCYAASSMFVPETATMHPEVFVRTANWQYFFAKQGSKIKYFCCRTILIMRDVIPHLFLYRIYTGEMLWYDNFCRKALCACQ